MDLIVAILLFGVLQTACTVSRHRWPWAGPLVGVAAAVVCYASHPWAAQLNFGRLNAALAQPGALASLATLLLLEAVAKVLERFHEPDAPIEGRHGWFRVRRALLGAACFAVRYLPPLSLPGTIFYAQLYAFDAIEGVPFAQLSLLLAAACALLIAGGSLALRRWVADETRALLGYRLLFLQLLVALVLPVVGRLGQSTPLYNDASLYFDSAAFAVLGALIAALGFLARRRLGRRLSP